MSSVSNQTILLPPCSTRAFPPRDVLRESWRGSIEVPINTDFKGTFLELILRESGASVLGIDVRWVHRLDGPDVPDLRHVVVVGDAPTSTHGTVPPTGIDATFR